MSWRNGTYEGEILANVPHGKGKRGFYEQKVNQVDSIVQEGIFFAGIFFKGTEKTVASWDLPQNGGDPSAPMLLFNKLKFYKSPITPNTVYTTDLAKSKSWTGKTDKKGMPIGTGNIRIGEVELALNIKDGIIKTASIVNHYTVTSSRRYVLTRLNLTENNMVNELSYTVLVDHKKEREVTLPVVLPLSIACIELPEEGPAIVKYENGNRYEGFYTAHAPNGFGVYYRPKDGYIDSGYFRRGQLHGWGQRTYSTTAVDSGYFRDGDFLSGAFTTDAGNTWQSFPKCLSGNCNNGTGKASYQHNSTTSYTYEGQMLQGLPHGTGTMEIKAANNFVRHTGNFVMGEMLGYGSIETNVGVFSKMEGYFQYDSLTHGTIHYSQSGVRFRSIGLQPGTQGFDPGMQPLSWGKMNKPAVAGEGILYTKAGAVVRGNFNSFYNLMDGTYTGPDGYQLRFGDRNRDHLLAVGMGGQQELNMQFDNLDFVVATYRTRSKEQQEQAAARREALEAEARQQKRMDSLMRINSNWSVTTHKETCRLCNGKGTIGNPTLGGDIDYYQRVYDKWGNLVSSGYATIEGIGPKRARRITCTQCFGKGVILVQDKKYIGPNR